MCSSSAPWWHACSCTRSLRGQSVSCGHTCLAGHLTLCARLQLTTILVNIIGNFEVTLDPSMGGWAGCKARELNAFTLILVGGNLLRFTPRA